MKTVSLAPLVALVALVAACGTDVSESYPRSYKFGPFQLAPGQEDTDLCVAVTLHNTEALWVNAVDMVGAPGIHHSNWFWVPDSNVTFAGFPEGAFSCAAGDGKGHPFNQQIVAYYGGVVFAQSTQLPSDSEKFPLGDAIYIPPNARIVADIHLLNTTDGPETIPITLTLHPVAENTVTTIMNAFSMENLGIALPPQQQSSFTVECDLSQNRGQVPWNFHIVHALAHYHQWGTGLSIEAIRDSDGGADMIYSTASSIGSELGGILDPAFDMTGHSKVRLTCDYDNDTNNTIYWGNGGAEMCIFFGYTDSPYVWTAGLINTTDNPGPDIVGSDGVATFTAPACTGILAVQANN